VELIKGGPRRKSGRCYDDPSCVWFRQVGGEVEVSDTATGPRALRFTPSRWTEFVAAVTNGEFDRRRHVEENG
jgi:hypothetical protein